MNIKRLAHSKHLNIGYCYECAEPGKGEHGTEPGGFGKDCPTREPSWGRWEALLRNSEQRRPAAFPSRVQSCSTEQERLQGFRAEACSRNRLRVWLGLHWVTGSEQHPWESELEPPICGLLRRCHPNHVRSHFDVL